MLIKKLYLGDADGYSPALYEYQPTDIDAFTMEDDCFVLFFGDAFDVKATFRQLSRRGFYNPCNAIPRKLNEDRVYGVQISDGCVTLWGEDSILDLLEDLWNEEQFI